MNPELHNKVKEWMDWDKNEKTLKTIELYHKNGEFEILSSLLMTRLSFGTAGLRGKMDAGYASMNDLVIIQTGQGLLKYLESEERNLLFKHGIVVGYDGRHNSKRWAEITATIFVQSGYKARLFSDVVPTPFIPFSVKKYKCAIGVMVTASHNPKDDNGYKVYGSNSAQIVSPVDKKIQAEILNNLEPLPTSWDIHIIQNNELCIDPLEEVLDDYLKSLSNQILPIHKEINKASDLFFTYTAMHGVGYKYVQKVATEIGVNVYAVPAQKDPDPEFSTVKFPNPEEGKSCLNLSFKLAAKIGSTIVIANDPDADRMACAEKDLKTGEWKVFTGNEIGALLGWWLIECYRLKHPGQSVRNVYMISSTVSSMILRSIANKEGFNFIDTLTGFKWIGNKALELEKAGNKVVFCFEEAIGFMCGTTVVDKDGVSAAAHMMTLASYLHSHEVTLTDKLNEIYTDYGYHVSINSYFICHDKKTIKAIFERIRNCDTWNKYPQDVGNHKYVVASVRDLTTGYDNTQPGNKAILPVDPSSQMITFNFMNGLVCTLRTSGTEPKIKYYTEMCATPEQTDREAIVANLKDQVNAIIEDLLRPEENKLLARTE